MRPHKLVYPYAPRLINVTYPGTLYGHAPSLNIDLHTVIAILHMAYARTVTFYEVIIGFFVFSDVASIGSKGISL